MIPSTEQQFDTVIISCKDIFLKKIIDYGTAWRVLRTISVVDQIFIKALRIKNIQELKTQKVKDNVEDEWKGIINYAIIGLIQLQLNKPEAEEVPADVASKWYDEQVQKAKTIMMAKNHDYGEAWRSMSQESFIDLILMKLLRIKQILQNEGTTLISEGIDANFIDILNYAVFALILQSEQTTNSSL
jgi:hypothetical protein